MKRFIYVASAAFLTLVCFAKYTPAQEARQRAGKIIVPESSIVRPEDAGRRAHTNIIIFAPSDDREPGSAPAGETPASLACVYQLVTQVAGCPINGTTINPSGGANAIGIVDAYDAPTIENDLGVFSSQFNLPACTTENGCFTKVYASGTKPPKNGDWALEISLDVEWSHAMAPNAKIILVEAASQSAGDLLKAEDVASAQVAAAGGGEVTNSWGFSEASKETTADSHFTTPGIVYFAAAGDTGAEVLYPSASPNVVSAGGTTVNRNGSGDFTSETAWSDAGGGPSKYEPRPSDQDVIESIVGSVRGTPDISFDANPSTGVSIYDSTRYLIYKDWIVVGGTSVASPSLAGIVNSAGSFYSSSNAELTTLYDNYTNPEYFRDITSGSNGHSCVVGWDYCSGIGSVLGYTDK